MDQQMARAYVAKHVGVPEDDLAYEWHDGPGYTFRQLSDGVRHTVHPIGRPDPVVISHA